MTKQGTKPYRVLLYYKYVHIENPEAYVEKHLKFCKALGVKGRILVAEEGINGTISGTVEQTTAYMNAVRMDPRFEDMVFKVDEADGHAFKKMHVRHRKEIVNLSLEEDVDPNRLTGKHLEPKEFYRAMLEDDVIILDARNDYEYEVGHFRGAVKPDIKTFRELPQWIKENLQEHKDKKILAYCTGGIRCEKLTGFLIKEGFQDVNQLKGGIITYGKDPEVKGKRFDGKCYVFDERLTVPVNQEEDIVVGHCYYCGEPEDRVVNCANPWCNKQHIACEECERKYRRSCSKECREHQGQPV